MFDRAALFIHHRMIIYHRGENGGKGVFRKNAQSALYEGVCTEILYKGGLLMENGMTWSAADCYESRRSNPSRIVQGLGGHPGMKRSTGRTSGAPWPASG
jgi:hypothetical protein